MSALVIDASEELAGTIALARATAHRHAQAKIAHPRHTLAELQNYLQSNPLPPTTTSPAVASALCTPS